MSPTTKTPRRDSPPLRPVSNDPGNFQVGRWWLLAEGLVVVLLGASGLLAAADQPGAGRAGADVLWLRLTTLHASVLLAFGVLCLLATPRRRAAALLTGATVGFLLLFTIGTVAAVRTASGPWGFDLRDSGLHVLLLVFNLALFRWLFPDGLEGPRWIRRQRPDERGERP
jgi:hypothetical protein